MKKIQLLIFLIAICSIDMLGQISRSGVKTRKFKTTTKLKIEGEVGYLIVPENRKNPSSREIKIKYVHLKSLSNNPAAPVIYLEGGGGTSTWQVESPRDLTDWLEVLEVSDLIFIDRRGTNDKDLLYIWKDEVPEDFMVSEQSASEHYQKVADLALQKFDEDNIDVTGYNLVEHATDVHDLTKALGIDKYSIFGFSFGSQIGMTAMKMFPDEIERAILVGPDAPNQSFNYPQHLESHIDKIGRMIEQDQVLSGSMPKFRALLDRVMQKLSDKPVVVTVKNPLTRKDMQLKIGAFGLALILRLDIDDANDIPAIPRLLHSIDTGNYDMLTWFAQKRIVLGMALPGHGINQQLASGADPERWTTIENQASTSKYGNVVNFPFSALKDHWISNQLEIDTTTPIETDIPTLFIVGSLDCRTPLQQVKEIRIGFTNATVIEVENAGHEQAMWDKETFNDTIPGFLKGNTVQDHRAYYTDLEFLPLVGPTDGHPSMR